MPSRSSKQSEKGPDMVFAADIGESFQRATDQTFEWLPKLVGALVIVLVGYIVARVIARLVRRAITAAGADRALESGPAATYKQRFAPTLHPSDVIGKIAF